MKRHASFIIAVASLLILAASAHAETYYRFELYGSANVPLEKDFEIGPPQSTVPLEGEYEFSPGLRGGIRFGVDGLGRWGQDISYSYGGNSNRIVVDQNGDFAFNNRSHQFAYNVLFYPWGLRARNFFPYVTTGVGGTIFTVSQETVNRGLLEGLGKLENHTSFTFNVGGGFRYQFSDFYGFRLDVRDWMSHPPRYGIPDSSDNPAVAVFPVKGVFQQLEFSVAFVYAFRSR